MSNTPHARLQRRIRRALLQSGHHTCIIAPPGDTDWPDLLVYRARQLWWCEVKASEKWLRPGQEMKAFEMAGQGSLVVVMRDVQEVNAVLFSAYCWHKKPLRPGAVLHVDGAKVVPYPRRHTDG